MLRSKKRRGGGKEEEGGGGGGGGAAATAAAPPPPQAAAGGGGGGDGDEVALTKKIRAVEKKLRQITELKELKAGGKPLEKNQLDKIEQFDSVTGELTELQGKLEALKLNEQGQVAVR